MITLRAVVLDYSGLIKLIDRIVNLPLPLHSVLQWFSACGRLSMSMMSVLSWDCVMEPMELFMALFMDCPALDIGRMWFFFLKNTMILNFKNKSIPRKCNPTINDR